MTTLFKLNQKMPIFPTASPTGDGATRKPAGFFQESVFQRTLLALLLCVVPCLLLIAYYKALFPGLTNDDAIDFAQLGRNLSGGRGFVTYFLRPLALTHGANPLRQPDMTHGPLYPFVLALAFGARGAKDSVASAVSGLFYLLTVPVLYRLGSRVFNHTVGILAALVFMANSLMLEYAISGLHITLYVFLTTCLLWALHTVATHTAGEGDEAPRTLPASLYGLTGVLTGALYLTDPIFVWIFPVVAVALLSMTERAVRVRAALCFLVPLCVLCLPWMGRNTALSGNPIFGLRGMEVWMGTRDYYPGLTAYRMTHDDIVPSVGLFKAVVNKILLGSGQVIQAFPQVSASWVLAFFLPCLLFRFTDTAVNFLRRVMMYCLLGLLTGSLLLGIQMPLFICLVPTMLVFAIAYLLHLIEQARLPRNSIGLVAGLMAVALFLPVLRDMTLVDKPTSLPDMKTAQMFGKMSRPGDLVLSDQPWVVAWYADRPSAWIPAVDAKIGKLRTQFPQTRWLFLTGEVRGFSPQWSFVYDGLLRWNQTYAEAEANHAATPGLIRLGGNTPPLLGNLEGFTTLPPQKGAAPSTVIAAQPDKP